MSAHAATTAQPLSLVATPTANLRVQYDEKVDRLESDYDAQLEALNQAERLAIEALRLKLQADLAAFRQQ